MSSPVSDNNQHKSFRLSLDTWAVLVALALAAAVRFHILSAVPW
jgi:hypothetical protein